MRAHISSMSFLVILERQGTPNLGKLHHLAKVGVAVPTFFAIRSEKLLDKGKQLPFQSALHRALFEVHLLDARAVAGPCHSARPLSPLVICNGKVHLAIHAQVEHGSWLKRLAHFLVVMCFHVLSPNKCSFGNM